MNIVDIIRVQFSKAGNARYISHLDLVRTMTRVMRRAQIPMWYTEGFSKHPYITFAAPLSLGYTGQCEYMDFRLEQPMEMTEIVDRLNRNMPDGLHVIDAAPIVHKVGEIAASRWRICFPTFAKAQIEKGLSKDALLVQKRTKKGLMKEIDIKPSLTDLRLYETEEHCVLEVTLPTGEGAINPSLLIHAVFGEEEGVSVTRTAVLMKNGEKFC